MLGHPPFFLCLASCDRPRFSSFQKNKITQKAMKAKYRGLFVPVAVEKSWMMVDQCEFLVGHPFFPVLV